METEIARKATNLSPEETKIYLVFETISNYSYIRFQHHYIYTLVPSVETMVQLLRS